jgi:hypothetical protein
MTERANPSFAMRFRRPLLLLALLFVTVIGAFILYRTQIELTRDRANATHPVSTPAASARPETSVTFRHPGPAFVEPKIESGPNAANDYKRAFALSDQLTDAERGMLANFQKMPDSETAKALAEKIQPIIELLKQAAKEPKCDWGYSADDLNALHSESRREGRRLAQAALFAANYQFAEDPSGAFDILNSLRQFGHNVSDNYLGAMLNVGMLRGADDVIAINAARLASRCA